MKISLVDFLNTICPSGIKLGYIIKETFIYEEVEIRSSLAYGLDAIDIMRRFLNEYDSDFDIFEKEDIELKQINRLIKSFIEHMFNIVFPYYDYSFDNKYMCYEVLKNVYITI